jgi:hypothetical protein
VYDKRYTQLTVSLEGISGIVAYQQGPAVMRMEIKKADKIVRLFNSCNAKPVSTILNYINLPAKTKSRSSDTTRA